uniref:Mannose-6-phosphate isomerase type II C-terminal domain-containing protein n=1 Tax=uncultured marine microorganism HF4000_007I05 TaxID=455511 RepID=B3T0X7_9ZZZZ|nr:hypothetical protein ALOHA_HF4000007I05ctg1g9 [uncultured marine microorganism HF4000_007I05]
MKNKSSFYDNRVVNKPWGYEYTIYRNFNNLSITLLKINYKQKTSLHCHPKKKTGFIVLDGKAKIQLGLYRANSEYYLAPSKLMIRTGLFHSIKAVTKKGVYALEFETPVNKHDLIRFKDDYGRQLKPYEGKSFSKRIDSKFIKFKKPVFGSRQSYKIGKVKIFLEVHKNFKKLINKNDRTIFAILNGKIIDSKGRNVISYGDIIKTGTLRKLSAVFKIDRQLTILRVSKYN